MVVWDGSLVDEKVACWVDLSEHETVEMSVVVMAVLLAVKKEIQ